MQVSFYQAARTDTNNPGGVSSDAINGTKIHPKMNEKENQ